MRMSAETGEEIMTSFYGVEQVEAWELGRATGPHVHHITENLEKFLRELP